MSDCETIFSWQHDVEHQGVEVLTLCQQQIERSFAIAGNAGRVTLGPQIELKASGDMCLIFDD
jgi:hypothetical protein